MIAVFNGIGAMITLLLALASIPLGLNVSEDRWVIVVLGVLYLVVGLAALAAAVGLWKLRPWGRALQIGLSVVGLLGIPVGTIISGLILYYLFRPEVRVLFAGKDLADLTSDERRILYHAGSGASVAAGAIAVIVGGLVMVSVCGIIAAIAIPNMLNAINRGRQKRTVADIQTIARSLDEFATDHGQYPPGITSVDQLEGLVVPKYTSSLPTYDAWRNELVVETTQDGSHYEISSLGRDKLPGPRPGGETLSYDCDIVYRDGVFVQWPAGTVRH